MQDTTEDLMSRPTLASVKLLIEKELLLQATNKEFQTINSLYINNKIHRTKLFQTINKQFGFSSKPQFS